MQVARAMYTIEETHPHLALCDPREGRFLVVESSLYPFVWAGQLVSLEGGPVVGTIQLEARSFEGVLQSRYLPTDFAVDGSSGAVFTALWQAVERENPTGVSLSDDLAAGLPFDGTNYGDRSLFDAWNLVAQQTGHEWWLEHAVVNGQLVSQAQFRPARGLDRTEEVRVVVGPYGNARINRWRMSVESSSHRLRAIAGQTSATEAFSARSRVERRAGAAPVSTASLVVGANTRHGYDFLKVPTGSSALTRAERIAILENVRSAGSLAVAAEALLRQGRSAENVVDIEIQGAAELWQHCAPGDVIRLTLPSPYFIDGVDTVAAIIDTEAVEESGTLRLNVEVPSA
jgi:hypothetical protein